MIMVVTISCGRDDDVRGHDYVHVHVRDGVHDCGMVSVMVFVGMSMIIVMMVSNDGFSHFG